MKDIEEILKNPRISLQYRGDDGFKGIIAMPTWRGSVIFSYAGGWEHCSVSPSNRRITPSWDDMTMLKSIFWDDEEAVIQVHPPKSQYVNNLPNCLHLWRCYYAEMLLPPSCFVGIREGQTMKEMEEECRKAYALAGEEY